MNGHVCDFDCDQPALGVVAAANPDPAARRRPICHQHALELQPEHDGRRYLQGFGALTRRTR